MTPGAGRCGRYGSCSTRASALSAAGCWGMYEIARTVQCSWKRCVASRHPAGPGAALYQQSGRCGCALPLQRLCAARHPERKVSGQAWRAVEMGNRLVQLAFGGELTVQYGELLPQPVPWAAIGYDLIVPVPASGKRRGYNVPELMALPLAKAMEVPLAPQALERTRAKRHQAGLPLEQRIANVAGAFRAAQPQQLEASASCWWMTSSPPAQQLPPARRHCFTPGQTAYSRWPLPRWSLAHRRTTPPPSMRTMRKMCIAIFENNALSRILLAGKSRDSKM